MVDDPVQVCVRVQVAVLLQQPLVLCHFVAIQHILRHGIVENGDGRSVTATLGRLTDERLVALTPTGGGNQRGIASRKFNGYNSLI